MKKKLFVDFDGVLSNTIKTICMLYDDDFQYYRDYKKVDWSEIETWNFTELNCANREYIDKYFNQPRFFRNIECMPWAKETMNKLSGLYDITIVSMGYRPNLIGKQKWVNDNFPDCEFIGVNFKEHNDKGHIDMSDSIFIDDSANNLMNSNAELKICFGDEYEWNKNWNGIRCANWFDVWKLIGYQITDVNKYKQILNIESK